MSNFLNSSYTDLNNLVKIEADEINSDVIILNGNDLTTEINYINQQISSLNSSINISLSGSIYNIYYSNAINSISGLVNNNTNSINSINQNISSYPNYFNSLSGSIYLINKTILPYPNYFNSLSGLVYNNSNSINSINQTIMPYPNYFSSISSLVYYNTNSINSLNNNTSTNYNSIYSLSGLVYNNFNSVYNYINARIFTIGYVETLSSNSNAYVSISGIYLNFGLVTGPIGATGAMVRLDQLAQKETKEILEIQVPPVVTPQ